jgi:hypothetical protein
MGGVWVGPGGLEVEAIVLHRRALLRVSQTYDYGRVLIAYCATPDEVAQHVALADLCEVIPLPEQPGQRL